MNKKILIFIIFIIFIIIISCLILLLPKKDSKISMNVYNLNANDELNIDDYIVIRDIEELKELNSSLEFDLEKNDYLFFKVNYNPCSEGDFELSSAFSENKVNVTIKYKAKYGLCAPEDLYYYIKLDKGQKVDEFKINYKQVNKVNCPSNVAYKPIIYLYPEEDTFVSVKLLNNSYLTTTYPKYNNGWKVFAKKDGVLVDINNNREYYGLYWEGNNHFAKQEKDGFVISSDEVYKFLEEKLRILGLTDREANEFIIYWLPILEKNKYNYIRFESIEEINNYMPISIEPEPDTIIRILMDFKPLNDKIDVDEQILRTPKRTGFTVVEWGGSKIE